MLEGHILARYGTYDVPDYKWSHYLKVDLTDTYGKSTVRAEFEELLVNKFTSILSVGTSIRISGFNVCPCNERNDGGSSKFSIATSPRIIVEVLLPFSVNVRFLPKTSIRSFLRSCTKAFTNPEGWDTPTPLATIAVTVISIGASTPIHGDLVVADWPDTEDLATLAFWKCWKVDYNKICEAFTKKGYVAFVIRNMGAWRNHIRVVLSVLDGSIIAPDLVSSIDAEIHHAFDCHISGLGYGHEVVGEFSISTLNGPLCVKACSLCKFEKINQEVFPPTCGACSKATPIVCIPKVRGWIVLEDGSHVQVNVAGVWVDEILKLGEPFMDMLDRDSVGIKSLLNKYEVVGHYMIDHCGDVRDFERPKPLALQHR